MIDKKTGKISFSNISQELYPRINKVDFLSSVFKNSIKRDDSHSTASIYVLNPMELWCEKFNVTLIFDASDKLYMVLMAFNTGVIKSWDNWSEDYERKLKIEHDNFLETHLGRSPYDYSWGVIGSDYDPRSGSSMITVRYY